MHFFSLAHPPHHYSQTAWQTSWWKFQPGIRVFKRWREKSAKLSKSGQFSSPKARNYVRFVRACVRVVRPGTGRVFRCVFFQWVVRPAFSFAIASEVEKNPFFRAFSFLRFRSLFIFADHRRKLAYCGGWWGDEGWPLPEQPFRSLVKCGATLEGGGGKLRKVVSKVATKRFSSSPKPLLGVQSGRRRRRTGAAGGH